MARSPKQLRRAAVAVAVALAALILAGCGGGGSDAGPDTTAAPQLPAACQEPPVTFDLQAGGDHPAGAAEFTATDAVARRVAILPGKMAFDPSELSGLQSEAGVTPLALYSLYLADYEIPRDQLSGVGFGDLTPGDGQTIGTITIVPADEGGFHQGDVVTDGELGYETRTTFAPLGVTVYADGDHTGQAYTDVTGQVEILHLDDESICLDVDVTLENQGEMVYRAKGTVLAPVVRAADAFFFT